MKARERRQVTNAKGAIVFKKAPKKLNLDKWKGRCGKQFVELGYSSVDKFIEDVRGR